ncbi:hypothetical protein BDY21DRAFT_21458 [Lineolata rhizophorae]|uniref:Uncharacterized protein n=1 Tax=Lineolata rhizophorae TaxID=578093 RepID=A0A6A6P2G2_9PEZI|nr:hypothetical protein BDY21DRAFT_21458 [Lineolata rhizophorae]
MGVEANERRAGRMQQHRCTKNFLAHQHQRNFPPLPVRSGVASDHCKAAAREPMALYRRPSLPSTTLARPYLRGRTRNASHHPIVAAPRPLSAYSSTIHSIIRRAHGRAWGGRIPGPPTAGRHARIVALLSRVRARLLHVRPLEGATSGKSRLLCCATRVGRPAA